MKKILALSLAVAFCFSEQFRTEKSYEKVDVFGEDFFPEIKQNLVIEKIYDESNMLTSIKKYIEETNELLYLEEFDNGTIKSKTSFITTSSDMSMVLNILKGYDDFAAEFGNLIFEQNTNCLGKPDKQLLYDKNGFLEMMRVFACDFEHKKYFMLSETPYSYAKDRNESLVNGIEKVYNRNGKLMFEFSYKFGKFDGESKKYCDYETKPCKIVKYKDGKKLDDAIPYQ